MCRYISVYLRIYHISCQPRVALSVVNKSTQSRSKHNGTDAKHLMSSQVEGLPHLVGSSVLLNLGVELAMYGGLVGLVLSTQMDWKHFWI
jgi:hypothetical protein